MQRVSMAKKSHVEARPPLFVLLADLRSTRLTTRTLHAIVDSAGKLMTRCASSRFCSGSRIAGLVQLCRLRILQCGPRETHSTHSRHSSTV